MGYGHTLYIALLVRVCTFDITKMCSCVCMYMRVSVCLIVCCIILIFLTPFLILLLPLPPPTQSLKYISCCVMTDPGGEVCLLQHLARHWRGLRELTVFLPTHLTERTTRTIFQHLHRYVHVCKFPWYICACVYVHVAAASMCM